MRFYHNITKGQLNETEPEDLAYSISPGDQVFYTESGDAILKPLPQGDIDELIKKVSQDNKDNSQE